MIRVTAKIAIIAGLWYGAVICSVALGQGSGESDADVKPPTHVDDEIIVRGRTPEELRLQMQLAEDAVYGRFNEIDSSDELDIHCRQEPITGSRIPRRICEPNFFRKALTQAGEETLRKLQGSYAFDSAQFLAKAQYKRLLLAEEMRRLASQDKELQNDLVHVAELKQTLDKTKQALAATTSTQQSDEREALPYGAAVIADVRIGRKPWKYVLTEHIFSLAHVYGKIRGIEVECRGHTEKLRYQVGMEWTLPDDWTACTLRVEARRGTSFALFEFE